MIPHEHEAAVRLLVFAGTLGIVAAAELLRPRRRPAELRLRRWITNLAMVAASTALVRVVLPVAAVGWAGEVEAKGWGLFNRIDVATWLEGALAFVLLDLAIFGQHWLAHRVPLLWRLHRMHHSDLDFDASTGVRFHPLEIVLSMVWKMLVVTVLGASALSVLVFEVVLSSGSLWEHANFKLPPAWDRWLRALVVTPDMHRIHHSWHAEETNSNYGFNFSFWDRLFRTYRPQPRDGHHAMTIGLRQFRAPQDQGIVALLLQPARRE